MKSRLRALPWVFGILLIAAGSLCTGCSGSTDRQKTEISQEENVSSESVQEETETADEIVLDYKITELVFPEELLDQTGRIIQQNAVWNDCLYIQLLDQSAGGLYPTRTQYAYDPATGNLKTIMERDGALRVMDFTEQDGQLYESLVYAADSSLMAGISADGETIWESPVSSALYVPKFMHVNGKLQYLVPVMQEEGMELQLLEIEGKQVQTLFAMDLGQTESGYKNWSADTVMQNSSRALAFSTAEQEEYLTYIYDGSRIQTVSVPELVTVNIPLLDGVLIMCQNLENESPYSYYWIDYQSGQVTPAYSRTEDPLLRMFGQSAGNRFFFIDLNQDNYMGWIQSGQLCFEKLEELPSGINSSWLLSDGDQLVFTDSPSEESPYERLYGLYLIEFESAQ